MKKIAILSLHMNYGGVEKVIASQANYFSKKYKVEIIVVYNNFKKPVFDINDNVSIKYLTNIWPNKEQILDYYHQHRFFKLIIASLKGIIILMKKRLALIKYIKHSDADIIISTRVEFSKLLGKYNKKVIKIGEEHTYQINNPKYVSKMKKSYKHIDYLVCVSKELTNFYSNILNYTKCIYIPNGIDYWPAKISKLNNYNLVSVGRFSPEKGFPDLIDIFYMIYQQNNKFILNIIGDGVDKNKILEKINKYKINNNVILHGFQNKNYINKILEKSSLYLMTSYEESFGIVLLEAASFGVPAIAFDSAKGACEIITNNNNGILIKNRNFESYSKNVLEVFNNKEQLKKLGKCARNNSKKFYEDKIETMWLNFLLSIK